MRWLTIAGLAMSVALVFGGPVGADDAHHPGKQTKTKPVEKQAVTKPAKEAAPKKKRSPPG